MDPSIPCHTPDAGSRTVPDPRFGPDHVPGATTPHPGIPVRGSPPAPARGHRPDPRRGGFAGVRTECRARPFPAAVGHPRPERAASGDRGLTSLRPVAATRGRRTMLPAGPDGLRKPRRRRLPQPALSFGHGRGMMDPSCRPVRTPRCCLPTAGTGSVPRGPVRAHDADPRRPQRQIEAAPVMRPARRGHLPARSGPASP